MSVYGNFKVDLSNPNSTWTILLKIIKPNTKVLDVGCSSGYFAEALRNEKGCIVDGIEIDEQDAKIAQKYCRNVYVANAEQTDFVKLVDDRYDYIIFADVLEHLIDPSKVLKNVSKVLNKNGSILFSIPNMAHSSVRMQLLQGNFDYEEEGLLDRTHLHFYTKDAVWQMVTKSNLYLHKLDATTFDIPKQIINDALSKVGLINTPEFNKYITSADNLVYQFIGVVKRQKEGSLTKKDYENSIKAIKPKLSYEKELASVQKDARSLFERLKNEEAKTSELSEQLQRVESELSDARAKLRVLNKVPFVRAAKKARRLIKRP